MMLWAFLLLSSGGVFSHSAQVVVYSAPDCQGSEKLAFDVSHKEHNCKGCWDSCFELFNTGKDAHGSVKSIRIPNGYIALTYSNCAGSFGGSNPGFQGVLEDSCQNVNGANRFHIAHFVFAFETSPGTYTPVGEKEKPPVGPFSKQMPSAHWGFGAGGIKNAEGTSWYTFIFDLLAKDQRRMTFQVGTGGTWLKPTWPTYTPGQDACRCNPTSWPATQSGQTCTNVDKRKCTNGCCGSGDGCGVLMQTMEGGTGYWNGQLPTMAVKWRINAVTGCYATEAGSALWSFYGKDLSCANLGVIPVSNRFLLPADGIGFQTEGMLGQAWVNTPFGRLSENDHGRSIWTLVLDTLNFKGPVAYLLPDYWTDGKWTDLDGKAQPAEDFGKMKMSTGGGAFEWHTVPVLGVQEQNGDRNIRIPRMHMAKNLGDQTVLMTGFKSWEGTADLWDPLEAVLQGNQAVLAEDKLMGSNAGVKGACYERDERLQLPFEGSFINFGGIIKTRKEKGECVAAVHWDPQGTSQCNSSHCNWAEAFRYGSRKIKKDTRTGKFDVTPGMMHALDKMPPSLASRSFPPAGDKTYDRSNPNLCDTKSAGDDPKLHCRQTKAGDWIGYRWYRFVDQPGMQRLGLSQEEKAWVQARIERLHKAMMPSAPLNAWLKPPKDLPQLVEVDAALLVEPPEHLKAGYIPVVVYQALAKHSSCLDDGSGPGPTAHPTTQPPPSDALQVCKERCAAAGYCCSRHSGCGRPSCHLGCEVAHSSKDATQCKQACAEMTGKCSLKPKGFGEATTCQSCMTGASWNGTCAQGHCEKPDGCDRGCDLYHSSSPPPAPKVQWTLGKSKESCTAACTKIAKGCDEEQLLSASTKEAIERIAKASGHQCKITRGWAYDHMPGVCTASDCCGGSCVGTCSFGDTGERTCDGVAPSPYSRLCPCVDVTATRLFSVINEAPKGFTGGRYIPWWQVASTLLTFAASAMLLHRFRRALCHWAVGVRPGHVEELPQALIE